MDWVHLGTTNLEWLSSPNGMDGLGPPPEELSIAQWNGWIESTRNGSPFLFLPSDWQTQRGCSAIGFFTQGGRSMSVLCNCMLST